MNEIQIFNHKQFGDIRTMLMPDGQIGFVGNDVAVEQGLFDTTVTIIKTNHGSKERVTTKVTGKGQEYFINGFISGRFSL